MNTKARNTLRATQCICGPRGGFSLVERQGFPRGGGQITGHGIAAPRGLAVFGALFLLRPFFQGFLVWGARFAGIAAPGVLVLRDKTLRFARRPFAGLAAFAARFGFFFKPLTQDRGGVGFVVCHGCLRVEKPGRFSLNTPRLPPVVPQTAGLYP